MEMIRFTSVILFINVVVDSGDALRCQVGVQGVSLTVQDCAGSCVRTEKSLLFGQKAVTLSCSPIAIALPCTETFGTKVCYCNTDLCSTGGSGSGGGGVTSHPETTPTTPTSSGSSALKVTWMVTCLVAIVTAAGSVTI